jgi:hypothetical protein
MATNFRKGMEASIGSPGMKLVQYEVDTEGGKSATINAKDIGLSTILYLDAKSAAIDQPVGTEYAVVLGTFRDGIGDANYATVSAHRRGTATGVEAGTFQIFAVGM